MEKRIVWIDYSKTIAILLVVTGHVICWLIPNVSLQDEFLTEENLLLKVIYSFHMPLFMFVSGYLFMSPKKIQIIGFKNLVVHRTKQLMIPFFFCGFFLYLIGGSNSIFNYWYLRSLFEFIIISYPICVLILRGNIPEKIKFFILFCISFTMCGLIKLYDYEILNILFDFGCFYLYPFFVLGIYLRYNERIFKFIIKIPVIIFILLYIICFLLYSYWPNFWLREICALNGVLMTISMVQKIALNNKGYSIARHISNLTIDVYVLHFYFKELFINHWYNFNIIVSSINNIYIIYILIFLLSIFIVITSLCLSKLMRHSKLCRILFFGSK